MANYTVTLAEIIRDMANPAIPSYDFSALIKDTWEKIVPTKFPMWEESTGVLDANGNVITVVPRERLICKILAHYYTWEIGYENQNMWLFAFNRKLSEIMPYYVQLEKTMGVDFNPFLTTDIEERYGGETGKEVTAEGQISTNSSGSTNATKEFSENISFTGEKTSAVHNSESSDVVSFTSSNNTSTKTGTDRVDGNTSTSESGTSNTTYGKKEVTDGLTKVTDSLTTELTGSLKETLEKNETQTVNYGSTNTHTKTGTVKDDSNSWNKFSATPQGSLTDVESGRYLTDARKIEDGKLTTYNLTEIDKKTGNDTTTTTGTDTKNTTTKNTETNEKSQTNDVSNTLTFSGTDKVVTSEEKTGTNDSTTTYNTTTKDTGSQNVNTTSESTSWEDGSYHDTSTTGKTGNEKNSSSVKHAEEKLSNDKSLESGTSSYLKKIKGRNSQNIADQIEKWRELIINIELMIIQDMQDLFMQVF